MNRSRKTTQSSRKHRGFTLFELIASMAAASVLMVGLSSALYIAVQGVDVSDSPSAAVLDGQAVIVDMQADLQYALTITEQTLTAITVTIPDRDDPDTAPETIRYAWGGNAGDPITRQYNGGVAAVVVPGVQQLNFHYLPTSSSVEFVRVYLKILDDPNSFLLTTVEMVNRP